jgi:hypothetical protein
MVQLCDAQEANLHYLCQKLVEHFVELDDGQNHFSMQHDCEMRMAVLTVLELKRCDPVEDYIQHRDRELELLQGWIRLKLNLEEYKFSVMARIIFKSMLRLKRKLPE